MKIEVPKKFEPIMMSNARFQVAYGGRGSSKSWGFAIKAILLAIRTPTRFLCCREYQTSIQDSVHRLLVDTIERYNLKKFFKITHVTITCVNGSQFLFKGIKKNINEIKSMEGVMVCWVTEAAKVSATSWDVLIPTIRAPGSQIWLDFNPDMIDDETFQRFVENPHPHSDVVKIDYWDNPFLPQPLIDEAAYCKEINIDKYNWVWGGQCRRLSEASVFGDKVEIREFETPDLKMVFQQRFFFGADWGFSRDPTVLLRLFILDNCLYIDREMSGVAIEIMDLPKRFKEIEGSQRWPIFADGSRPETISHMRNNGFNCKAAKKWAGSVEEGVEFLRAFRKIIISPSCKVACSDFLHYSYKIDKNTEDILPVLVDAENHAPDAARYALDGYIGKRVSILDVL